MVDCEEGSARSTHFRVSNSARVTGYSFPNPVMQEWRLKKLIASLASTTSSAISFVHTPNFMDQRQSAVGDSSRNSPEWILTDFRFANLRV